MIRLELGDCLDKLKELEDNSVDSIVTDPPYGLSFMNAKWDYDVPSQEIWEECLRVLKPGGHLLSFSGSRTYHRMAVRIEDAGFQIRDQIMWIYGSGFPKSHNIGKALDKRGGESIGWFGDWLKKWRDDNNIPQSKVAELFPSKTGGLTGCVSNWELGNNLPTNEQFNLICETFNLPFKSLEEAEREYIGTTKSGIGKAFTKDGWGSGYDEVEVTKGNSKWEGWGTALKPAHEPIVLARKPLSENTNAENVLKWGTGGLNIDVSRIGYNDDKPHSVSTEREDGNSWNKDYKRTEDWEPNNTGRWPANIILDEEAGQVLDEQSGISTGKIGMTQQSSPNNIYQGFKSKGDTKVNDGITDKGGASRFFYCPKTSKKDRDEGCDELELKQRPGQTDKGNYSSSVYCKDCGKTYNGTNDHSKCNDEVEYKPSTTTTKNNHPTVKPTSLMEYLIKLVTPVGGTVLDPFMGSGSTGKAAVRNGFNFIGIEREEEYLKIAEARINNEFKD